MKTTNHFLALLIFCSIAPTCFSQNIINGSFEKWDNASKPTGWSTLESASGIKLNVTAKTQTAGSFYEGITAISLTTDSINTPYGTMLAPAQLNYGTGKLITTVPDGDLVFYGAPFTSQPDSFSFAYKYSPVKNDTALGVAELHASGVNIATSFQTLTNTQNKWKHTTLPFTYRSQTATDTLFISFFSSTPLNSHVAQKGSVLWIDDVKLVYNTAPITKIKLSIETKNTSDGNTSLLRMTGLVSYTGTTAVLTDKKGKQISKTVLKENSLDISALPKGKYLLTVYNEKNEKVLEEKFTKAE
jgi:hypothetical protein